MENITKPKKSEDINTQHYFITNCWIILIGRDLINRVKVT